MKLSIFHLAALLPLLSAAPTDLYGPSCQDVAGKRCVRSAEAGKLKRIHREVLAAADRFAEKRDNLYEAARIILPPAANEKRVDLYNPSSPNRAEEPKRTLILTPEECMLRNVFENTGVSIANRCLDESLKRENLYNPSSPNRAEQPAITPAPVKRENLYANGEGNGPCLTQICNN
jgi:hypothetical protein